MCKLQLTLYVLVVVTGFAWTQDPNCDYSQRLQVGYSYDITNKNYPNSYTPGVQCRWILQCPDGYNCKLDCNYIDIPYTSSCTMDRLMISQSGDPQLNAADHYCGQGTTSVVSTGQILTIGLITSFDSPGGSFNCSATTQKASSPSCSCGYKKMNRIIGGQETGVNEYPSMAGIVLDVEAAQIGCGGIIISKRYVLTAAHCLRRRLASDMAVVVGEHDVTTGDSPATRAYRIEDFLLHPRYNMSTFDYDYDIAIIRVAEDIAFGPTVGPICLPFKFANQDITGKKLTALGWGLLSLGGITSKTLQKVELDVISQSQCKAAVPRLTARQFCTYTSGKDTCQHDSGGPLLYSEPATGTLYDIGIISYGNFCGMEGSPGVNTRVADFLNWIVDNTPDADYCEK